MTKPLIAYFTWSGNSAYLASLIQQQSGGTLFQIRTKQPYPTSYPMTASRAYKELQQGLWPELAERLEAPEQVERLYLVYPNWCGTIPMAVSRFLTEQEFGSLTIYPVCSSGGSGMTRSVADIQALCPKAELKAGLLIRDKAVKTPETEQSIRAWLAEK